MADEQNGSVLHRAARAFEMHPARLVWAAFVGAVTFFFFGFAFVKGLEDARGLELVPRGAWLWRSETAGYVKRQDIDADYMSRAVVARDFTPNGEVQRNYIRREECQSLSSSQSQIEVPKPEPSRSATNTVTPPQPMPTTGAAVPATEPPTKKTADRQFASRVEFGKPTCKERAGMVKCTFQATNRADKSQKLTIEVSNISGSSFFCYLVDSSGMKYFATDAEIGGVRQYIWHGEILDPDVPVSASLIFEVKQSMKPPLAISFTVRIQPTDDPNIGNPQAIFFREVSLQ